MESALRVVFIAKVARESLCCGLFVATSAEKRIWRIAKLQKWRESKSDMSSKSALVETIDGCLSSPVENVNGEENQQEEWISLSDGESQECLWGKAGYLRRVGFLKLSGYRHGPGTGRCIRRRPCRRFCQGRREKEDGGPVQGCPGGLPDPRKKRRLPS